MEEIIWSDQYSVGIPSVDAQHQAIVEQINRLLATVANSSEHIAAINALITLGTEHLSHEEDLLIDYDYPNYEQHHAEHQRYKDGFYTILSDPDKPLEDKTAFIKSWWNHHILYEDMKYKPFFAGKAVQ